MSFTLEERGVLVVHVNNRSMGLEYFGCGMRYLHRILRTHKWLLDFEYMSTEEPLVYEAFSVRFGS